MSDFNGLGMTLGNLSRLSSAKSRSITAENPTGAVGAGGMAEAASDGPARDLGQGWKTKPYELVGPGQVFTLAEIEGPGALQSFWFAGGAMRDCILRIYWDGQEHPSVECPISDFFAVPWAKRQQTRAQEGPLMIVNSLPVAVNPNRGLNCFWEMPFRESARVTVENRHPVRDYVCFYQINYTLTDVPDDCAYFHAQFRRENPVAYAVPYTIVDAIKGCGHYVGTSMGWGINNTGWWGEGEIKFYMDGDDEFPTICGTGTEDYFGGAYDWEVEGEYVEYSTPFMGMHQVIRPDGMYDSQHRHAMYRWHIMDPIRFEEDLRVTIQSLGWRGERRYLPMMNDVCSVAYWYQTMPHVRFPALGGRDDLEIV